MRQSKHDGNLTMRAFAGTHVVLLGWSMTKLKSRVFSGSPYIERTIRKAKHSGSKVSKSSKKRTLAQRRLPYARIRSKASPGRTSRRSLVTNTPTAWSP